MHCCALPEEELLLAEELVLDEELEFDVELDELELEDELLAPVLELLLLDEVLDEAELDAEELVLDDVEFEPLDDALDGESGLSEPPLPQPVKAIEIANASQILDINSSPPPSFCLLVDSRH